MDLGRARLAKALKRSGEGVGPQARRHRGDHLEGQLLIPFDGVPELRVAENHRFSGPLANDGCRRRPIVEHADLTEEFAGPKRGHRFPSSRDLRRPAGQDVEGARRLALGDKRLPGPQADLIDLAGEDLKFPLPQLRKQRNCGKTVELGVSHVRNTTRPMAVGQLVAIQAGP